MVQRIKKLCRKKGITIAELERRCEIGNGIIARWKSSQPSYERLSKVARELDTTVEYLHEGEETPTVLSDNGLSPEAKEFIRLYRLASPELQTVVLAALRYAAASDADYDKIKAHAEARGEAVNGFIKRAISETIERDNKSE